MDQCREPRVMRWHESMPVCERAVYCHHVCALKENCRFFKPAPASLAPFFQGEFEAGWGLSWLTRRINAKKKESAKKQRNKSRTFTYSTYIHNIFRIGAEELGEWKRRGIASSRPICPMFGTTRRSLDCCQRLSAFVNAVEDLGLIGLEWDA